MKEEGRWRLARGRRRDAIHVQPIVKAKAEATRFDVCEQILPRGGEDSDGLVYAAFLSR